MTKVGPVLDVFVSEAQGLMCIDIEVSSPVHNTVWIQVSRGFAHWECQSSGFAPETEGTDTVFMNGGTAVAQASPKIRWPPSDRLHPGLSDFQARHRETALREKDTWKHEKFTEVKDVGV